MGSRKALFIALWIVVALIACSACERSSSHCYLCQGIPQNEPCIVNLATGDIAVLSAGGYGRTELSVTGGITVVGENGELCRATIPTIGGEMNHNLFCGNCQSLIENIPNSGYVLADLHDLSSIQFYTIEDATITIREYVVSIIATDNGYWKIRVVTS